MPMGDAVLGYRSEGGDVLKSAWHGLMSARRAPVWGTLASRIDATR